MFLRFDMMCDMRPACHVVGVAVCCTFMHLVDVVSSPQLLHTVANMSSARPCQICYIESDVRCSGAVVQLILGVPHRVRHAGFCT